MNSNIISHRADPDGVISAGLLKRAHGTVDYHFVNYWQQQDALNNVASSNLYIADLGLKEENLGRLEKLAAQGEVTWIDHHGTTCELAHIVRAFGVQVHYSSNELCSAQLVVKHFLDTDYYAKQMAAVAAASDYGHRCPQGDRVPTLLHNAITWYNTQPNYQAQLGKLADGIAAGVDFDAWQTPDVVQAHLRYCQRQPQELHALKGSLETVRLGPHVYQFGYASGLLAPKPTMRSIRDGKHDAHFVVFGDHENNVWCFGSEKFNAASFAQSHGGGGRGVDGGFTPCVQASQLTYPKIKEQLITHLLYYTE